MARTQSADYEQRRAHILHHASRLFAERGFNGTSVAEIAAAAAVSKPLIYHYFPSKEELLREVMCSHIDELLDYTNEVLAGPGNAAERLGALLRRFTKHYTGAADRQKVLLNELSNLSTTERSEIVSKQRRIIEGVQALLVALDPSLKNSPTQARVKTMLLFGMINWMHTWYDPRGPVKTEEIADLALAMVQA